MKQSLVLVGAALLVAAPVISLLPGCGGSGNGLINTPATQTFSSNVLLSSGQTGILTLKITGDKARGTLAVLPNASQNRVSGGLRSATLNLFSFAIPVGTYTATGIVTTSPNFTVTGTFPAPVGDFTITGQVPANGGNGTYAVTANGQTTNGSFPVVNPTSAPTTAPTTRPTTQPTVAPTAQPTVAPTARPTVAPTVAPTARPTAAPTAFPGPTGFPTPAPTPPRF